MLREMRIAGFEARRRGGGQRPRHVGGLEESGKATGHPPRPPPERNQPSRRPASGPETASHLQPTAGKRWSCGVGLTACGHALGEQPGLALESLVSKQLRFRRVL